MPVYRILIWRQRFCDSVRAYPFFFLRRKKNSEKERPLRGLRREVRFIMSPPGKRRHNELNAAPPPETPRGTGKTGAVSDRGRVQSGESFCIRAKAVHSAIRAARFRLCLPLEGKAIQFAAGRLTVRALTCPRCAACTEPFPLIPHAVVVSPP